MRKLRFQQADPDGELPGWLRGSVVLGVMATLVLLECTRALRMRSHESKVRRNVRNLLIAAGAGLVMQFAERPLSLRLARQVHRHRWGISPRLVSGRFMQTAVAVLLLDYGLYRWHVLTHKVPFLWRFHLVHHVDLDLDASTALRFHFGEMLLSVPWRLAQIVLSGSSPRAFSIWQTLLFVSILFHHSNVELPASVERLLSLLVMTPRLHGIHHQADLARSNTNWSSGLTLWDVIHRTYFWDEIHGDDKAWSLKQARIGVPAYPRPADVTLRHCLEIPFSRQREDWSSVLS